MASQRAVGGWDEEAEQRGVSELRQTFTSPQSQFPKGGDEDDDDDDIVVSHVNSGALLHTLPEFQTPANSRFTVAFSDRNFGRWAK